MTVQVSADLLPPTAPSLIGQALHSWLLAGSWPYVDGVQSGISIWNPHRHFKTRVRR